MGSVEIALLIKYGVPLVIKLLSNGKEEASAIEIAEESIVNLKESGMVSTLLHADQEQTNVIVKALYDVVTGTALSAGKLIMAFVGLLTGVKNEVQ